MKWRRAHSRRHDWKRQFTCLTPLRRLGPFVQHLLDGLGPSERALIVVDNVIAEPNALTTLRRAAGELRRIHESPGHRFESDPAGLAAALEAAFASMIDFHVLFSPPRGALVADHDEYTTVLCASPGRLADLKARLTHDQVTLVAHRVDAP